MLDIKISMYNSIVEKFIRRMGEIDSFLRIGEKAVEGYLPAEIRYQENLFGYMLSSPKMDKIFKDKQGFILNMERDNYINVSAQMAVENCLKTIESASLVFLHSIFEESIFELCCLVSQINPTAFYRYIKNEKIEFKLNEFDSYKSRDLWREKLVKYMSILEGKSLIKKIDTLFAVCPNNHETDKYSYDKQRIEAFDKLRHEIVHNGRSIPNKINVMEEIDYIRNSFIYLFFRVGHNYDLYIIA